MLDRKIVIQKPALTPFNVVAGIIVAIGLIITVIRFTQGLGATTNLSDYNPWGIWIGFDLLVGVALAAGGRDNVSVILVKILRDFSVARSAWSRLLGWLR